MRKSTAYLIGTTLVLSSFIISQGCTKSSDEDLVGNWTRASDFDGNARGEAVAFVIGDYAYISTGNTSKDRFNDLWEYSLERKYWSQKASLPGVARNSAVGFALNGKGYVGTGYDGINYLKDFWEYDPTLNSWEQKDDFGGSARYNASAFAIGSKGYVTCGYDDNYLKDLWEFDPTAALGSQWTQKAGLYGTKRAAATTFVINDKAYVVSGNNNGEILKDLQMYDPTTDTWTEKRKIYDYDDDASYDDDYTTIARQNAVAFVMGNYAYLTTGENGSNITNTWRYDPSSDLWVEKTSFEGSARTGAVGFTLNNRGFVFTGRSGSTVMDNGYEFHPEDEQVDDD